MWRSTPPNRFGMKNVKSCKGGKLSEVNIPYVIRSRVKYGNDAATENNGRQPSRQPIPNITTAAKTI